MLAKDSSIFSSSGSRTRRRRRDSTLDRVLGVYGGRECARYSCERCRLRATCPYFDLVHIDIEVARSPISALSPNTRVLSALNEGPWSISRRLRASRSSTDALGIRDPLAQPVSCPPHVDSSPLARAVTLPTVVGVALAQVTRRVCPECSVCVCLLVVSSSGWQQARQRDLRL